MIKLIVLLFALVVSCFADEVKIRGASADEIKTTPWLTKAISDYGGIYVLRDQDGPEDTIVLSYFESSIGHKFISVMYIEKSFYNAHPVYHNLGVFSVDVKAGRFVQLYSKTKIELLKFRDVGKNKNKYLLYGLSLDGVLFKKLN